MNYKREEHHGVRTPAKAKIAGRMAVKAKIAIRMPAKRAATLFLALALCLGLVPGAAWAEASGEPGKSVVTAQDVAGKATLTIVYGIGWDGSPDIVVNKSYGFQEGASLQDLLDAAVEAGDITAYELNGRGFIESLTTKSGTKIEAPTNGSLYWSYFENGAYYGGGNTIPTIALEDGKSYQFAWSSYPTATAPEDWDAISTPDDATDTVAGSGEAVGQAALTIVYGLGFEGNPNIVTNTEFSFGAGATLEDLLKAAKNSGAINDYALNNLSFVDSITDKSDTIMKALDGGLTYWANLENGSYYAGPDNVTTMVLEDGVNYQLAWCSYPTAVIPNWDSIDSPSDSDTIAGDGQSGNEPQYPQDPNSGSGYDAVTFANLFNAIAASYQGTGEDWSAFELAAIGQPASVDQAAIVANAVASYNNPGTTDLQRSIIVLTSLGIDARFVESGGQVYDLVEKLAQTQGAYNTPNGKMFALLAFACGPYDIPEDALFDEATQVANVISLQNEDGGFSFYGSTSDADMTAMGIVALAPYRSGYPAAEMVIQQALGTLYGLQLPSGGFGSNDAPDQISTNSTAFAIIALSAVGIDARAWTGGASQEAVAVDDGAGSSLAEDGSSIGVLTENAATVSGSNPLSALLSQANAAGNGFANLGVEGDLATEQGFRALIAYQGFLNAGGAYNIYTQAATGLAGLPDGDADSGEKDADSSSTKDTSSKTVLAKTGDKASMASVALTAAAVAAFVSAAAMRKRLQEEYERARK